MTAGEPSKITPSDSSWPRSLTGKLAEPTPLALHVIGPIKPRAGETRVVA
jgi:hypothetical protein